MSVLQSIIIAIQKPKNINLSYQELEDKCKKILEGKGHIGKKEDYWDFLDNNGWTLSTVLGNRNNIIYDSFNGKHNFIYYAFLCKNCGGIFQLPFETKECLYCNHKELEKERKRVRHRSLNGRAGVNEEVHPDLYAAAVKDIQEHGQYNNEPSHDIDWKYLEDNI